MNKHPILMGTLILTVTGFLSRILGFFYRIFLSRAIGAEGLGLYQMIFPVHGIAFALCAGSIQTAISQLVASGARRGREALRTGLFISLSIAAALTASIFCFHDALAEYFLLEPACGPSAGHGPVHSVLRGSRVYLRLLLWAQESQGARRLPAGGTGHTDFFCISCGGYIF